MLYMVTFTINIHHMLAYIPYMDPMGIGLHVHCIWSNSSAVGNDMETPASGPFDWRC
jgi:hypothetical protein